MTHDQLHMNSDQFKKENSQIVIIRKIAGPVCFLTSFLKIQFLS
jgi:hypothetical protein